MLLAIALGESNDLSKSLLLLLLLTIIIVTRSANKGRARFITAMWVAPQKISVRTAACSHDNVLNQL